MSKTAAIELLTQPTSRIVPNYELAPDLQQVQILRVVIRENVTEVVSQVCFAFGASYLDRFCQLLDKLIADIVSGLFD